MSGRNSESLCGIDVSPHSCLHWVCPTAHERKWRKKAKKKKERERREENREKKKLTPTPKLKITLGRKGTKIKQRKKREKKNQVRNSVSYFFLQTDAIGQLICQSEHN